jgi:sphingomyelin phosphodiesterase
LPPKASDSSLLDQALAQINSIIVNPIFGNNSCAKCQASLEVAKFLALAAPEQGPTLAVKLCLEFNFSTTCEATYGAINLGSVVTQVVANADVGGYDGQVLLSLSSMN